MSRNMQSGSFWRNNISSLVPFLQRLGCTSKVFFLSFKASFFFFELRCRLRHPVVMRMASLMLHTCLLIPPYPVFEIEIKISLI